MVLRLLRVASSTINSLCHKLPSPSLFSTLCRKRQHFHIPPPPVAKKVPFAAAAHGVTWKDSYRWMSDITDPDFISYINQENSYADAFMRDTQELQKILYSQMISRMPRNITTPPENLGPLVRNFTHRWLLTIRELITSTLSSLISYLQQQPPPPPPLLPVAAVDPQQIMEKEHNLELGKLSFTLATTATLGLLFSDKFPAGRALYLVIVSFMAAAALLWNGIFFGKLYLQVLGITLCLVSLYGLVASFLPTAFSCACCLFGAFCFLPFLYLLTSKPQPPPPPA